MIKTKNKNNNYFCHSELVSESITTSAWRVGKNLKGLCQRANGFRTKSGMTGETGRSMVEMLGVLAIIGVLSVGGIAGYTMAMNKYKANEIVNGVSTMYMLGMSANKGQGSTTDMLYSTTVSTKVPTGASEITYKTDKTVVAAITDTGVCDQVKNQLGDKATGDCGSLIITLGAVGATSGNCFLNDSCSQANCAQSGGVWCNNGCFSRSYCLFYDSCLQAEECDDWTQMFEPCMKSGKSAIYCECYENYQDNSRCTEIEQCVEETEYSYDACDCISSEQPEDDCKNL